MKNNTANDNGNDIPLPLPVENELLMLKLRAEFGAECRMGDRNIAPEIVNDFLKSVYEFESHYREKREQIKIFERIGRPSFIPAHDLSDADITAALRKLLHLLRRNNIQLDIMGEYPDRQIYIFITEELFNYEMEYLDLSGYIQHLCYEDFHPNHEMDIRQRVTDFLTQWFSKKMDDYSCGLGAAFIHPDGREFSKEQTLRVVRNIIDSYTSFREEKIWLDTIRFKWDGSQNTGRGFVSGTMSYKAVMENGEYVPFSGPFEFYLSNNGNWWSIFYFIFPGFKWNT